MTHPLQQPSLEAALQQCQKALQTILAAAERSGRVGLDAVMRYGLPAIAEADAALAAPAAVPAIPEAQPDPLLWVPEWVREATADDKVSVYFAPSDKAGLIPLYEHAQQAKPQAEAAPLARAKAAGFRHHEPPTDFEGAAMLLAVLVQEHPDFCDGGLFYDRAQAVLDAAPQAQPAEAHTYASTQATKMRGLRRAQAHAASRGAGRAVREDASMMQTVAALFVRRDSCYKQMPGVDCYDIERDARNWPGGCPVVAHPPCRLWGKLRQFARAADPQAERMLAVQAVQAFGGVLEHPAESTLWAHCGLPLPGRAPDRFGGWTAEIRQCDYGHEAEKLTWLYIGGCHPDDLPPMPPRAEPIGVIKPQRGVPRDGRKIVTKAKREHTPPELARWLVETARRCRVDEREAA